MKTHFIMGLIAAALALGCAISAYPQNIIAGQHSAGNYFIDIDPDTTLTGPNNHLTTLPAAVYPVDIDGDGTEDFTLYSYGSWVNGWGNSEISIQIHDTANGRVAYGYTDTCRTTDTTWFLYRMAKSFRLNDVIDRNQAWVNDKLFLAYTDWFNMGYNCDRNGFSIDSSGNYLGVRLIKTPDTIYGWIRIRDVSFLTFTVQEYAGSKNCTGIDEVFPAVKVYPNPASDKVTVETGMPGSALVVYNPFGTEVMRMTRLSVKTVIDFSRMSRGIYIIRLSLGGRDLIRKVVITDN